MQLKGCLPSTALAGLLHPAHRHAMTGQIRLGEAARVAGVSFGTLCKALRGEAPASESSRDPEPDRPSPREGKTAGDWFEQAESLSAPHLDVRPLLASGQDPFAAGHVGIGQGAVRRLPGGGRAVRPGPVAPGAGRQGVHLARPPDGTRSLAHLLAPRGTGGRGGGSPDAGPRPGALASRRRHPSGRARPATARTDDPRARPDRRGRPRQSGAASRPRTRPPLSHAGASAAGRACRSSIWKAKSASGWRGNRHDHPRRRPAAAGIDPVPVPGGSPGVPSGRLDRSGGRSAAPRHHRRRARPAGRGPPPDDARRADRHGHGRRLPVAAGGDPGRFAGRVAVPPRQLAAAAGRRGTGLGHDDGGPAVACPWRKRRGARVCWCSP